MHALSCENAVHTQLWSCQHELNCAAGSLRGEWLLVGGGKLMRLRCGIETEGNLGKGRCVNGGR